MDVNEEWDAVLSQNKEEEILKLTVSFLSFHLHSRIEALAQKPFGPVSSSKILLKSL